MLIGLGVFINYGLRFSGIERPNLIPILKVVGVVGLILIVLEAALDLHLVKEKVSLIIKSFLVALIGFGATAYLSALALNYIMGIEMLNALLYTIPLSILSSAIILPSIDDLDKDRREFMIYESTFSDIIGTTIKADRKPTQLNKILLALYKEKERNLEANYELLYHSARKLIKGRSLLMLYTNFESMYALERVLPILRKINILHLLVVVFFENTEIIDFAKLKVNTTQDIYHQTIAQKILNEKSQMVQKLRQYGIQAILTKPEDLSVNSINKYLELKSRGLI